MFRVLPLRQISALTAMALVSSIALIGCGGSTKTVTQTTTTSQTQSSNTAAASNASSQNAQVIHQAAQANDNQAQLGADAIRRILIKKIGLNDTESFNLNHHIAPGDNSGDCYVKLGADAVNFEYQTQNILRAPNGTDVVFVQSNTVTPLVKCLEAVRTALNW